MTTVLEVPENPDKRPLPHDWVQEYDLKRQRWFYKQISVTPHRVSYIHPLGALRTSFAATRRSIPLQGVREHQNAPHIPISKSSETASYMLYKNLNTPVIPVAAKSERSGSPFFKTPPLRTSGSVDALPTPISPIRNAPNRRVTLPTHPPLSPTIETSQPGGVRSFYTQLRVPIPQSPRPEKETPKQLRPPSPPLTPYRCMSLAAPRLTASVQRIIHRSRSQSVSSTAVPPIPSPPRKVQTKWDPLRSSSSKPRGQRDTQQVTGFTTVPRTSFDKGIDSFKSQFQENGRPNPTGFYKPRRVASQLHPSHSHLQIDTDFAKKPSESQRVDPPQLFHGYQVTWFDPSQIEVPENEEPVYHSDMQPSPSRFT